MFKHLFVLCIFIISILMVVAEGDYANWYGYDVLWVDINHKDCDNSYDRQTVLNPNTPWCMLLDAHLLLVKSGDTIAIKGGDYNYKGDNLNLVNIHFDIDNPVTITGYANERVEFNNYWPKFIDPNPGTWTLINSTYNIWESTVTPDSNGDNLAVSFLNNTMLYTHSDPTKLYQEGYGAANISVNVVNVNSNKLTIRLLNNVNPNNISLYVSTTPTTMIRLQNITGMTIKNLNFEHNLRGVQVGNSQGIKILNNHFTNGFHANVFVFGTSDDVEVAYNTMEYHRPENWYWGLMKSSKHEASPIEFAQEGSIHIHHNIMSGWFDGIQQATDTQYEADGSIIEYNYLSNFIDDAIEIERYCKNTEYFKNTIVDSFGGFSLSPAVSNFYDCKIHYNIIDIKKKFVAYATVPLTVWKGECFKIIHSQSTVAKGWTIDHNTCLGFGIYSTNPTYNSNNQFNMTWTNNIFQSVETPVIEFTGKDTNGNFYDYNIYWRDGDNASWTSYPYMFMSYWNNTKGANYKTLGEALADTTPSYWNRNSRQTNPRLKDIYNYQYWPLSGYDICTMDNKSQPVGAMACRNGFNGDYANWYSHKTLWVDINHPDCNNSYNRTTVLNPVTPWCYLNTSHVSQFKAGDTVAIKEGTYLYPEKQIKIKHIAWDSDNPVTITGYALDYVKLANYIPAYLNTNQGLWTLENSTLNIWNTTLNYSYANDHDFVYVAMANGTIIYTHDDPLKVYENLTNPIDIVTLDGELLRIRLLNKNLDPNNISFYISSGPGQIFNINNVTGLTISNLEIPHSSGKIQIGNSHSVKVHDINFVNGLLFNIFVFGNSSDIELYNNNMTYHRPESWTRGQMKNSRQEASPIQFQQDFDVFIHDNYISGWFDGIQQTTDETHTGTGSVIKNNYITNIIDDGLELETHCNNTDWYKNYFIDNMVAISLSPAESNDNNCFIRYNVIDARKNFRQSPTETYKGECFKIIYDQTPVAKGWTIDHNTCLGFGIYSTNPTYNSNNQFNMTWTNNIFWAKDTPVIQYTGKASNGNFYDYNLYYRPNAEGQGGNSSWDNWPYLFSGFYNTINSSNYGNLSITLSSPYTPSYWNQNSKEQDPWLKDINSQEYWPLLGHVVCDMSNTSQPIGAMACRDP